MPTPTSDGLWAKEPPNQAADVRLILSGKFLDATKQLKGEQGCGQTHRRVAAKPAARGCPPVSEPGSLLCSLTWNVGGSAVLA